MAQIKIEDVVSELDSEFKKSLADTMARFAPQVACNRDAVFKFFRAAFTITVASGKGCKDSCVKTYPAASQELMALIGRLRGRLCWSKCLDELPARYKPLRYLRYSFFHAHQFLTMPHKRIVPRANIVAPVRTDATWFASEFAIPLLRSAAPTIRVIKPKETPNLSSIVQPFKPESSKTVA
jgi:hypothetical protein